MLDIMQFYVSGFWTWLGLTVGLALVLQSIVALICGLTAIAAGREIEPLWPRWIGKD